MPPRQRLSDEELFRLTSPSAEPEEEGPGWGTRLWEGAKSLGPFGGAAAMVRGLSGFLSPVKGGLPGAAFGGGAELLAQGIENIPRIPEAFSPSTLSDIARGLREQPEATLSGFGREAAKSAGRVGVESAIGAVPFGAIMKEARPIGSAIRGAGMAGGGQAAHEAVNVAAGDEVDPNEALKRILFASTIGGGATGAVAGVHAAATRGLEPPTSRGGTETVTYEVQPTAAIGGEVGIGRNRSKVLPIRPQTAHITRPRVSQEVPYRMEEPSTPSQHLADQFLQALEEEQALAAPMRLGQRVAYGSSIEDVPMTRSARAAEAAEARAATRTGGAEAARAAREDERKRTALARWIQDRTKIWEQHLADTEAAARIEAAKTGRVPEESVSETVSAPVPGGRETLRTRFVPEDPEAGPKRLVDPETGEVIGEAPIRPPADTAQGQLYDALTARGVPHERALQIASTSSHEDALRRLAIVSKKSLPPGVGDEPPPVAGAPVPTGPGPTPPTPAGAAAQLTQADVDQAERSLLLRLLMADLGENPFVRGGSTAAQRAEAMQNWRPGDPEYLKHGFVPAGHTAGTPIQSMLQAAGISGTRPAQLETLRNALMGTGRNRKVDSLIQAMREAWDGQRYDWNLVSQATLDQLGMRRRDFTSPMTVVNPEEFDADTLRKLGRFFPEHGEEPVTFMEDVTGQIPTTLPPGSTIQGATGRSRRPPKPKTMEEFNRQVEDILSGGTGQPPKPPRKPRGPAEPPPPPPEEPNVPYPGLNLSNLRRLLQRGEARQNERLAGMQARGGLRMLYDEPPTTPRVIAEPEAPVTPTTVAEEFPEVPITPPQGAVTTIPMGDVARNPLDAIAAQFRRVKAEAGELGKRDKSPLAELLRGRRSKLGAQLQNVGKAYPEWSNIPEVRGQAPSVSREAAIVEGALPPRGEAGPIRKVPTESPAPAPTVIAPRKANQEETEAFLNAVRTLPKTAAGRTKTINAVVDLRNHEGLYQEFDQARDMWTALGDRIAKLDPGSPEVAELYRAQNELATQIGNVARYASAAIKKGLEPVGPQVTDALARLRGDIESLRTAGTLKARGQKGPDITGQSGMANVELMSMLAGGLGGAALDPLGNPILSGLLGAGAGYALPRGIAKAGDIAEGLPETPDQWREGFLSAVEKVPQYQRATLLTQAGSSTIANTFVGPYGAGVTGAMEAIAKGDPRGRLLLKELGTPRDFIRAWREARPEAERLLAAGEEGRAEGLQFGAEGGWFDKATAVPGLWMLQGDIVVKRAAERAGFSPLEASQMSLTAEPTHPWIRPFAGLGRSSDPQQPTHRLMKALTDFMVPFKRTPANIAEAALFRTPGVGLVFGATDPGRTWRDVAVEQAGGLLGAGIGYEAGSELDPESARVGRRVLTNFAGRYSAPVGLGFAMGQAGQRTGDPTSAFNPRSLPRTLGDIFPLPTVDPAASAIGFLTEGEIPRGLLPAQEYIFPQEPTIRETIEGIPPLPRYRSR